LLKTKNLKQLSIRADEPNAGLKRLKVFKSLDYFELVLDFFEVEEDMKFIETLDFTKLYFDIFSGNTLSD
jgi:hypothetical protein